MINESGLVPLGRAVLVKPYQPEVKRGLIELPDNVNRAQQILEQRATVVAVGNAAWAEEIQGGFGPRAVPGDKVLISGLSGHMATGIKDGEQYRIVNDRDVFAKLLEDSHD